MPTARFARPSPSRGAIEDGGTRIVFHLRPGLKFSDGTPLQASDVVRSWLRIIDPAAPSPLTSLMLGVEGAFEYVTGQDDDPASVGLRADDATGDVTVELSRPGAEFVEVVASPTFGIVPPGVGEGPAALQPGDGFVASGGYVLAEEDDTSLTLKANPHYWAGPPAIATIELVEDIGGRSPVEVFEDGDLDYASIGAFDASWIAYDEELGAQLQEVPSLSVEYYGFDVRQEPFDDVRVRQAFGMAIDWRRIAELGSRRWRRRGRDIDGPVRYPGPERHGTSCPRTIRRPRGHSWPRPATRAVRASRT